MRIIDEITQQEITNPDLTAGELISAYWASPEAIASVDGVNKTALADEDYENVYLYHAYNADELAVRVDEQAEADQQDAIDSLPDAVAELSIAVSDGARDTADLADALAELSAIVSTLVEGD